MKVWISKNALHGGVYEAEWDERSYLISGTDAIPHHKRGKYWFDTKAEAVAQANDMRDKKVAELEMRLRELRAMNFDTKNG